MKKIMYIPLDERPCNYNFANFMLEGGDLLELISPPLEILGHKKSPANYEELKAFMLENISDCYGLIVSIDMLLYGGIVPSRLHGFNQKELIERLNLIRELKNIKPDLSIFAYSLIMRCPQYSSSDEEPDYYEHCGYNIFKYGEIKHKVSLGFATQEEIESLDFHYSKCQGYFEEYVARREINSDMNIETVKLLYDKIVDFLVFPQDDSSLYGLISLDQQKISKEVKKMNLQDEILIYPGADEVGMVLVSRMINKLNNKEPKIYIEYSTPKGHLFVPMFEDREIYKTIAKQIKSSGSVICDKIEEADGVLMFNTPTLDLEDANITENCCEVLVGEKRDIKAFVDKVDKYVKSGYRVSIADVAKINRGDVELVKELDARNLILNLAGYSGWNTSSNTLGTALSHLIINIHYGYTKALRRHLALRVYEDIGYDYHARKYITDNCLEPLGLGYFNSGEIKGQVSEMVHQEILKFVQEAVPTIYEEYDIENCYMPWCRMFEVALIIKERK